MKLNPTRAALVVIVLLGIGIVLLPRVAADLGHLEGTLVRVSTHQITLTNRDQTATVTLPLAPFIRITRNGETATLRDLARGDRVQVLTETRLGREFVTTILAIRP